MITTCDMPIGEPDIEASVPAADIILANGQSVSLAGMSFQELQALQWQQEQLSAQEIMAHPKGSPERSLAIGRAYDRICTILAAQAADAGQPLVMGLDPRYVRLVLKLLRQQSEAGTYHPRLFEVGYGCGALLAEVSAHGYPVAGIEVSEIMRAQAIAQLGGRHATSLLLGDLRSVGVESLAGRPTLIYWNDVLEHIPPNEVGEYVGHICELLAPGGMLVTISPNWLLRPSDVTGDFCPWRTEARGLHLKEYRLAEVTRLLQQAGFRRVATPLVATHRRLISCGSGGRVLKQCIEPWLDRLNVRVARLACRGLAMSVTIARK
jgi:SAM-dependent methyltransferase